MEKMMKCECGTEMKSRKENYRYTESGLDNVILLGVEVRRCPSCGLSEVVLSSEARGTASDDSTHGRYWVVAAPAARDSIPKKVSRLLGSRFRSRYWHESRN